MEQGEIRAREIADALPILVSYIDQSEVFRFANRAHETRFQVPIGRIVGRKVEDVVGSRLYQSAKPRLDEAFHGRRTRFSGVLEHAVLGPRTLVSDYIPDIDETGRVRGLFIVVHDQTQMAEQEARTVAILDGVPASFFAIDREWRVTYFNRAAASYFGQQRENVLGQPLTAVIPQLPPAVIDALGAAASGSSADVEFTSAAGGRLVALNAFPITGGVGVVFRDVTVERQTERDARQRLSELETIYRAAPVGLALLDRDLRYVRVNEALAKINRLSIADHIGRRIEEVVPGGVGEELRRILLGVFETGEPLTDLEVTGKMPDEPDLVRTCLENVAPVHDADGRATHILVSAVEITQLKQSEAALNAALEAQRTLYRELSHRVMNGFQITAGLLGLQAKRQDDPGAVMALREAAHRVQSMALIHRRLYRQSHEVGAQEIASYLSAICEDLRNAFMTADDPRRLSVQADAVNVPTDVAVVLGITVSELVTNALKHAYAPGQGGRILVGFTESDGQGCLTVEDEGRGLPPGFDLNGEKGLGMTVVRSQAAQIGGVISAEAKPVGARFRLCFPLPAKSS